MIEDQTAQATRSISFCSSLRDDAWLDLDGPAAFESWHFDAVSDDGREAIVIGFYDNYALSPRFYESTGGEERRRFPAVSLVYSVNGKVVLSSVNEFASGDFKASSGQPECTVAESSFRVDGADYGSGFFVTVDIRTVGGRRIHAELEWLLIESDLMPPTGESFDATWNFVAPRADVSGKITLIGRRGKERKQIQFRGTGYHDHISSKNVHYRDLASRMWGRAHFVDSTIIFERHGGVRDRQASGKFFLVRDGDIHERVAACESAEYKRDRWGLLVPRRISFVSDDNIKLRIKPLSTIRSGFSEVKMLSEITLGLRDGRARKAMGITEFVDPRRMKSRFSRWISDFRIGRNGRSPLF